MVEVESLFASLPVHDDADGGRVVDDLSAAVSVEEVLGHVRALGAVTVDLVVGR